MAEYSPMIQQYLKIKEKNSDAIVFYRLGDFYEMFFDDATTASKELELVLTGRDCGQEERAPMCGVPYHSAEAYIARLVNRGYKVAICEQTENPKEAKGLVKREIVRTITQGTIMENSMLDETKNNFICSLNAQVGKIGICFCDMSTGEVFATECADENPVVAAANELARFEPSEIMLSEEIAKNSNFIEFLKDKLNCRIEICPDDIFEISQAKTVAVEQFGDVICGASDIVIASAGALITHLKDTQKNDLAYINKIDIYNTQSFMYLDVNAKKNLEITHSLKNGDKKDTLLSVLDYTKTPMGGRLIAAWLQKPLMNIAHITNRLQGVAELERSVMLCDDMRQSFAGIYDVERIISRIVYGTANARDLRALCNVCEKLPLIKAMVMTLKAPYLQKLGQDIDILADMDILLRASIKENPPFSIREGDIIESGYNEQVDYLRDLLKNSNVKLAEIEQSEKEKTGIKGLKVGYNRIFGYYIEISRSYTGEMPLNYVRKQTLANCERYITEELKTLEGEILSAGDRSVALEYDVFCNVRDEVAKNSERFQNTAAAIATLDVLCSFAHAARKNNYTEPNVNVSEKIEISEGRHPVVENILKDRLFVPNDTVLDCADNRMAIITGPNMAGKSTYMKQTALIVIMAQCGSFVPAKYANIGICDKVFTRIGASDDMTSGKSTFMVEMSEVSDILKKATPRSLLILDEIGRGTSTFDGMSIARAVLEYAASKKTLGAKTMFATHYHELTDMENLLDGVKNYNIAVKKRGDDIIFLKKIVRGGADDSYGIEVAKLAGLPNKIITRAKEVLHDLENEPSNTNTVTEKNNDKYEQDEQIDLGSRANDEVIESLKKLTPEVLTPIEALNILNELVQKIK